MIAGRAPSASRSTGYGAQPDRAPATSFTIAIDEDEVVYRERVRAAGSDPAC